MCGIAGKVSEKPFPSGCVLEMGRLQSHRGPDGHGFYAEYGGGHQRCLTEEEAAPERECTVALSHQRLAIIDQSERGRQPMPNENGTLWLVFNGEIYNAVALRRSFEGAGHRFRSRSDSEIILHAYEEWGRECLDRFNGMFAFALWDAEARTLFCARDPLGIKPFYYRPHPHGLSFASEIKSFLADERFRPSMDPTALAAYLNYFFPVQPETWFSGVKRLLPGHALLFRNGSTTIWRYFEYRLASSEGAPVHLDELHNTLVQAVRSHLVSDVPVAFHLSGGLDSSSIAAVAQSNTPEPIPTFSGRFREGPEYDERTFIDSFRRRYPTSHREVVPDSQDFEGTLKSITWHLDEPTAGPGSFPQHCVSRLVRESGYKVVCGGQGGDELFGGYPWYLEERFEEAETQRRRRLGAVSEIFGEHFVPDRTRTEWLASFDERLNGLMSWDVHYYLPALLHVEDRVSMAWSVESRLPLLDRRLIGLASTMRPSDRVGDGTLKRSLREAMRPLLPPEIVDRKDKMGFPTPFGAWLRTSLGSWARGILLSDRTAERGFINTSKAGEFLQRHMSGEEWAMPLWQAVNTELWCRIFLDGDRP